MKRGLRLVFLIGVFVILGCGTVFANGSDVLLQLDGEIIETDVAPIIENDRTLVPYRALLEAMGADVSWDSDARMATAILGSHRVQVTIDNTTGFVNGITKTMDVPPKIVNDRTMIPVRFVLENLNCTVGWEKDTRTVIITTPEEIKPADIASVSYKETDTAYRITAKGTDVIAGTRTFALEAPDRYVIDIKNSVLTEGIGNLSADNEIFDKVRFSQFDDETVRIVVDLNEKTAGRVSLSEDRTTVYIDFDKPDFQDDSESEDEEDEPDNVQEAVIPELDWRAAGKHIVIDAGHGGNDPGASGYKNGRLVIIEKELNLSIALRLYDLLKEAGANVTLLRDKDVTMSLYSRPEAANILNADLLVSVHNNSANSAKPNGTEVLYYNKIGEEDYGFTSEKVASYIQRELVPETGLKDRGIIDSPHLAVLNKSLMPAVIIEGGFLSNADDLEVMLTDEFREAYAVAAAKGVINALNASIID